ncbi:hypothetical protein MMC13_005902 [Lambiella insularis]|nr:hypothetical protein [Lambiella insularis]
MVEQPKRVNVALIGDEAVGKTALRRQFVTGEFVSQHEHTVEESNLKHVQIRNQPIDVWIYDSEYSPPECLESMNAAIIVFSNASRETFDRLKVFRNWFAAFRQKGGLICMVGTHTDLGPPAVLWHDVLELANQTGAKYFPASLMNPKEAMMPWTFLLEQFVQSETKKDHGVIETPAPSPTPDTSGIPVWSSLHLWLGSMSICLGFQRRERQ